MISKHDEAKIIFQSPDKSKAQEFITTSNALGLDGRTAEKLFITAATSPQDSYSLGSIPNLEYAGIIDDPSVSEGTGQKIKKGVLLRNKVNGNTATFGLDTALKVFNTLRISNTHTFPEIETNNAQLNDNAQKANKEYATDLANILSGEESIASIQSTTERQQVRHLLNLTGTVNTLDELFNESLREQIIKNPLAFASTHQRIFPHTGTPLTQLKDKISYLSPQEQEDYILITKYKNILSPTDFIARSKRVRKAFDDKVPIPLTKRVKEYFSDLQTLVQDASWKLPQKETMQLLQAINNDELQLTATGFTALFVAYDIEGKRLALNNKYQKEHPSFQKGYERGKLLAKKLFLNAKDVFVGNTRENVPANITKEVNHLAKPGDKHLQVVQEHERNKYFANDKEDDVTKHTPIAKNEQTVQAYTLLGRKQNTHDTLQEGIKTKQLATAPYKWLLQQKLSDKDFDLVENIPTDLSLDDMIARFDDRYPATQDINSKSETTFDYDDRRAIEFARHSGLTKKSTIEAIQNNPEYTRLISLQQPSREQQKENSYAKVVQGHPAITYSFGAPTTLNETNRFYSPNELAQLANAEELASVLGIKAKWNDAKDAIATYKTLTRVRKGQPQHRVVFDRSSDTELKTWSDTYTPSQNFEETFKGSSLTYINPEHKQTLIAEMKQFVPITDEIKNKVLSLPTEAIHPSTRKSFETYVKVESSLGPGDYVQQSFVDRINAYK